MKGSNLLLSAAVMTIKGMEPNESIALASCLMPCIRACSSSTASALLYNSAGMMEFWYVYRSVSGNMFLNITLASPNVLANLRNPPGNPRLTSACSSGDKYFSSPGNWLSTSITPATPSGYLCTKNRVSIPPKEWPTRM